MFAVAMALDTAGLASAQLAPNSLAVTVETVSVSDNSLVCC